MIKQKKNNAKSVRMTDEVLAYVESQEGDGFNQRFENMVLFAMKTEEDRKKRIAYLDEEIQRKHNIAYTLYDMENKLRWVQQSLRSLSTTVENLVNTDNE